MLLRYLKEVVFDNNVNTPNGNKSKSKNEDENVSDDRRNEILKIVQDSLEKKDKENS